MGNEDLTPLVFPGEEIGSEEQARRKKFCSWHRSVVEEGLAESDCRYACLLLALIQAKVDYRNPDMVVIAQGITVGDLIRKVGYPCWERSRFLPTVLRALIEEAVQEREDSKNWFEQLDFRL